MKYLIWLLMLPTLVSAESNKEVQERICNSIVQAVEVSRWVLNYTEEETIQSFKKWIQQADRTNSVLRLDWYIPAVLFFIKTGYETTDRGLWIMQSTQQCHELKGA